LLEISKPSIAGNIRRKAFHQKKAKTLEECAAPLRKHKTIRAPKLPPL